MLFSSGDSPQSISSILSGEGLDEVQPGESPFVFSAACYLPTSLSSPATAVKLHRLIPQPAQGQPIVVTLATRVEGMTTQSALRPDAMPGDGSDTEQRCRMNARSMKSKMLARASSA